MKSMRGGVGLGEGGLLAVNGRPPSVKGRKSGCPRLLKSQAQHIQSKHRTAAVVRRIIAIRARQESQQLGMNR